MPETFQHYTLLIKVSTVGYQQAYLFLVKKGLVEFTNRILLNISRPNKNGNWISSSDKSIKTKLYTYSSQGSYSSSSDA